MTSLGGMSNLILLIALSGLILFLLPPSAWWPAILVTLLHLLLSAGMVAIAGPLLYRHIFEEGPRRGSAAGGLVTLVSLLLITLSGLLLTIYGQRGWLASIHGLAGIGFLAVLFAHSGSSHLKAALRRANFLPVAGALMVFLCGAMVAGLVGTESVALENTEFPFTSMHMAGEVPGDDELSVERCAQCHRQIVREWQQSMHAMADTELIYARVVGEFRRKLGVEASNWCAGCHSPLRLARGELSLKIADVAQANVNCVVCHSIRNAHATLGNGGFGLSIAQTDVYRRTTLQGLLLQGLLDQLLLIQPGAHKASWNGEFLRSDEFCGVCHRQVLPEFLSNSSEELVLQATYTEWAQSKYNSNDRHSRRTCRDCHMPVERSPWARPEGNHASHLFLGGSLDIARIAGAHDTYGKGRVFLQQAATMRATSRVRPDGKAEFQVKVTNSGAGHNLPTGVTDLRQLWISIKVKDESNQIVFDSGKIDRDGFLDPSAITFGTTFGDGNGTPVHFHQIERVREVLTSSTIPPGETREATYVVRPRNPGSLRADVELLYRSVPQSFVNHYMTPDLRMEIVVMAQAATTLTVSP